MTAPHWKIYEPIEPTTQFDENGDGPIIDRVQITAAVDPSPNVPSCRIHLRIGALAIAAITVDQSAQLRALLERAEQDVAAGMSAGPCQGAERCDG